MITDRDIEDAINALQSGEDFTFELTTPRGRRGILKRFSVGGKAKSVYLRWIDLEISEDDSRQAENLITAILIKAGAKPGPAFHGKGEEELDRFLRSTVGGGIG